MTLHLQSQIHSAAVNGDNDRAQELAVDQKFYYENFCSDAAQLAEWRRHLNDEEARITEQRLARASEYFGRRLTRSIGDRR
jgi:hypothetical protein